MSQATTTPPTLTIGIDLGDRKSHTCMLDAAGKIVEESRIATTPKALRARFEGLASTRIALEVGTHSAERLRAEVALYKEELAIKDARWARVPARRRPYYGPIQRMQILQLKAARGWSAIQTAERFLVREETIASWIGRQHLLRTLLEYVEDYNEARPHQSLDRNAPMPRQVEAVGNVCAMPVLGGLHHRYFRAA